MASERRRGQRVRYEQRLLTLAVATGLPAVALALLLLWGGDYATRTQWTLTVLLISVWLAVVGLLRERGVTRLVKSKSMLTEECHLNEHLEAHGVEVVDTDLGERIVQFRREPPSHIVMPAIHLKKEEIGELFHQKLGTPAGLSDPKQLTEAARGHMREKFLAAQAGLTGVNFAVAAENIQEFLAATEAAAKALWRISQETLEPSDPGPSMAQLGA